MISRAVAWSARHPLAVLVVTALVVVAGIFVERDLPRDALPDLSDPQVVLLVDWMGHPATEIANEVTRPLTAALQEVHGAKAVRGSSMSGMSYVDVVFDSTSDLSAGRAEIARRLEPLRANLPAGARLQLGPEASSTGWVLQYALLPPEKTRAMPMAEASHTGSDQALEPLRAFQDAVLKPTLSAIPGVAEVASLGGTRQEVFVETTPEQLRAAGLAVSDVITSLRSTLARAPASLDALRASELPSPAGNSGKVVPLASVARVNLAPAMATGMADVDGATPVVGGIVIAQRGSDVRAVIARVKQALEHERSRLPTGAKLGVVYDRSELAERVEHTLLTAVGEEVVVVALVVLLFLLHARSGLVPLITLPVVVLLTFVAMRVLGVPATIMSVGGIAIALGLAVDADLVALEACHRQLETEPERPQNRRERLIGASTAFAPAILVSLLVASCAFVPVFAFGGETGRLLRPLALSKSLVIIAAALVTLTLAPALRDRLLRGRVVAELDNPLTRGLVRLYRPFVSFALARPAFTLFTATLIAISCVPIVSRLGSEFLPRINEGDLLFMPTTTVGLSPADAMIALERQALDIASRPEVELVFGKVGRAETATDPAPFSMAETTIRLKPRALWPKRARARWYSSWAPRPLARVFERIWPTQTTETQAELVESLDQATRFPGWVNAWTAPVRARMDMMSTGVSTPVGARIVASDPARLDALGAVVQNALSDLAGTKSALYESLGGELRLAFEPDAAALARQNVDPDLVREASEFLISGGQLGSISLASLAGANAEALRVRLSLSSPWLPRPPEDVLREATVRANRDHTGQPVPLGLLGRPVFTNVPAMLRAEAGELCAYVHVDVRDGTDLTGYVEQARGEVERALGSSGLRLAAGERLEWIGQYQLLAEGQHRLAWIAPLVLVCMLGLLLLQFRSLAKALIVLVSVPLALVGSIWTLYLLDYRLSAPVWVGLLSVVGLAMQTGVLMIVYIDDVFERRVKEGRMRTRADIVDAHAEGTVQRLRPKIMTITTMGASLLPLLWAQGAGAEIMRRVAAPMLGGLVSSAFLTLEVLPVVYTIWRADQLEAQQEIEAQGRFALSSAEAAYSPDQSE